MGRVTGPDYDEYFKDKWKVPHDLEKAQQYLAEAGVPDGFSFELVCVTDRHPLVVEICEPVANEWEGAGLGLEPQLRLMVYQGGIRDRLVNREFAGVWGSTDGAQAASALFYPVGDSARRPDAAFNTGLEHPEILEIDRKAKEAETIEEFEMRREEGMDWISENHFGWGVVSWDEVIATNPEKIGRWPRTASQTWMLDFERLEKP
jgi:hypothetical protein